MAKAKHILNSVIEIAYILDQSTKGLVGAAPNLLLITDGDRLGLLDECRHSLRAIVILAELEWHSKVSTDYFGFDLGVELRRKYKFLTPLVIISITAKSVFEHLAPTEPKYRLLYARGTAFLNIGKLGGSLTDTLARESLYPLNNAVLQDMNEMLFDNRGALIEKLTHDLRPWYTADQLVEVLNETKMYLTEEQFIALDWDIFRQELIKNAGDQAKIVNLIDAQVRKCQLELKSDLPQIVPVAGQEFSILILEDDPDFRNLLYNKLSGKFHRLVITGSAEEVLDILRQDLQNDFVGLISDWRLYRDFSSKTYWQLQGYEVLDHAAKNHFIALFALTSLSDQNVNNIRNVLNLDIHLFKKQHYYDPESEIQWDIMADIIKEKCLNIYDLIAQLPTAENWKKWQPDYIKLRGSGWRVFEHGVSQEASELFVYYARAIDSVDRDERLVKNIKQKGYILKNELRNILVVRRVFLGIYFKLIQADMRLQEIDRALLGDGDALDTELKHHAFDTHSLLFNDWWDDISNGVAGDDFDRLAKNFDTRAKNTRNTVLCIKLSELPARGMLPEERAWLARHQIDFALNHIIDIILD